MPAFYTHRYFAQKIYNNFSFNIKKQINYEYFLLFSQSFDILFYNSGLSKKGKEIKLLGHKAHQKNTQAFFINIIKYILNNKDVNNQEYLLSFLYGTLTHYVLDSTMHPYIFYKSGLYKKDNIHTYKCNGLHTKNELLIDYYFYKKDNLISFHKAKLYKLYDDIKNPPAELLELIDYVFEKTFYKKNIGKIYFRCFKKWRLATKYLKRDPFKIKKRLYRILDKIRGNKHRKMEFYSYYIKDDVNSILNKKHLEWFNPADKSLKYNYDIDELFHISLKKYMSIFQKINDILNEKDDIKNVLKYIPNISYHSGMILSENRKMKYFED